MDQLLYQVAGSAIHTTGEETDPSVVYLQLSKGFRREIKIYRCEMLCLLKGQLTLSYDRFLAEPVAGGQILLLSPGIRCSLTADSDISLIVLRPEDFVRSAEGLKMETLPVEGSPDDYGIQTVPIKKPVGVFLRQLLSHLQEGLLGSGFLDLKTKEFFYLLRAYYTPEELSLLFHPLYSHNAAFAMFIFKNYRYVKTVSEFARLYNCSLSNFDKNFRQAFGISSYKWMMKRKIDLIFNELLTTRKPLKQIAEDTGFASQPQFTDFCKKHLGASPGELRKTKGSLVHDNGE